MAAISNQGLRSLILCGLLFSALFCGGCKGTSSVQNLNDGPMIAAREVGRGGGGIRPGEILDVYVLNDDSFTGRYQVHSDGEIVLRKVGRINVGGMAVSGAEAAVTRALSSQLTDAKVVVARAAKGEGNSLEASKLEVFVSGKVGKPGRMEIQYDGGPLPTVHEAILQAGGFTRFAHKKKVYILRKGNDGKLVRIPADITAIERGEIADVSVSGGDIVVVPEKSFGIGP